MRLTLRHQTEKRGVRAGVRRRERRTEEMKAVMQRIEGKSEIVRRKKRERQPEECCGAIKCQLYATAVSPLSSLLCVSYHCVCYLTHTHTGSLIPVYSMFTDYLDFLSRSLWAERLIATATFTAHLWT